MNRWKTSCPNNYGGLKLFNPYDKNASKLIFPESRNLKQGKACLYGLQLFNFGIFLLEAYLPYEASFLSVGLWQRNYSKVALVCRVVSADHSYFENAFF